jgi:predicted secreted protein with PEFG-CTERM motif
VKTDRTSYTAGSTVTISGNIADDTFAPGLQIALQVLNPEKAPYRFDPVKPDDDGSYSYSLVIGGPLGITGKYQVKVNYNGQAAETSFDLTGGVVSKPTYNLKVADKTYPIEYQADGSIKSMFVRAEDKKLVVSIDATQDGTLTLVLPREVIDAVEAGSDIKYVVATEDIDTGAEGTIDVREGTSTGEYRTLVIDYDEGTDLIEIQGTNVVPEFGTLSAIVLAIAILSIVALTAKFSNRFSNNIGFGRW